MKSRPHAALPDESDFIARSRNGDKDAYRVLVQHYQDRVFSLVLSMVRNQEQAEDVTQDAFVKAYFALGSFKGDSAFFTWLYRIASNTCLDYLRKHKPPEVSLDQTLNDEDGSERIHTLPAPTTERPEAALENEGEVSRLLDQLPPEQRLILNLREGQGYAYEEIAIVMKCGVNTVKSRLNRAREALKEAYEAKFGAPEGANRGNIQTPKPVQTSEETDDYV